MREFFFARPAIGKNPRGCITQLNFVLNGREKRAVGGRMIKVMTATKRIGKIKPGEVFLQFSGKHQRLLQAGAKQSGLSEKEWFTRACREKLAAGHEHETGIDGEALKRILTPNSVAVVERMMRDHALSAEEVIRALVDESLHNYEEDIAENGKVSGGELEWGFVRHANRIAAGRQPDWGFWGNSEHRAGSVSFYSVFGRARIRKLKKTMGSLNPSVDNDRKKLAA